VIWTASYLQVGSCRHPECMVLRGGSWKPRDFPSLVVHLRHPVHGHVLFDTGYAQAFREATRPFPERLYAWATPVDIPADRCAKAQLEHRGIPSASIGTVVLSHLHGDHAAGLEDFPEARIVLAREAWEATRNHRWRNTSKGVLPALLPADLAKRAVWIEDLPALPLEGTLALLGSGRELFADSGLRLVSLPGHAPGHHGAAFEDPVRGRTLLLADAAWTGESLHGWRPPSPLAALVMADRHQALDTLRKLVRLREVDPDLLMVPSHCRKTLDALA
jgi:glyoxylase-like metal-dependent hydrolase (beta-lactamase superfamily II)